MEWCLLAFFFLLWRRRKASRRCGSEAVSGCSHFLHSLVRSGSLQLRDGTCPVPQRSDLTSKLRETAETACVSAPGKVHVLLRVPSCVTLGVLSQKAHFGDKTQLFHMLTSFSLHFSVDNSEYMRNGDFLPTRLQAQQDAVNIVCHSKTRSNPENNVGLITLAKYAPRGNWPQGDAEEQLRGPVRECGGKGQGQCCKMGQQLHSLKPNQFFWEDWCEKT